MICCATFSPFASVQEFFFSQGSKGESRLGHIVITRCIKIAVCYGSQGEWRGYKRLMVFSFSGHYSMWQKLYTIQLRQRATGTEKVCLVIGRKIEGLDPACPSMSPFENGHIKDKLAIKNIEQIYIQIICQLHLFVLKYLISHWLFHS